MNIFWDIETFSQCNLKDYGAHRYATDPSTGIFFFCYACDGGEIQVWRPGASIPGPFAEPTQHKFISDNWEFDPAIHTHILVKRYGFPSIPRENQDCAQRLALANAYPAELGLRCEALGLPYRKDPEARKAMLRLSRPQTAKKRKKPVDLAARERDLALLLERCKADVSATRAAYNSPRLRPLLPEERLQLLHDATINTRGVHANVAFLEAAHAFAVQERNAINTRLNELTAGVITSVNQVDKIVEAVNARGHNMTSLNKRSVAATLAQQPESFVRELLELRQRGAYASTHKFKKLLNFVDPTDHRIRGALRIYGAGPGRWSSIGAQLHNLPRNDDEFPLSLIDALLAGNRAELARWGNPLEVVSELSRAALSAAPGHTLICVDFGAIESRINAWLAGETWKLDAFRRFDATGDKALDLYRVLAHRMLHKNGPVSEITAPERQLGKCAELACGFGGSVGAWRRIAGDDGRSDAEVMAIIKQWRDAHPAIRAFWHDLAQAARVAIRTGHPILVAAAPRPPIIAAFDGYALTLTLPSGRAINYPGARLAPNGKYEDGAPDIEFLDNARGQWKPARAWFGMLVENCCGSATQVLTATGWKYITDIQRSDLIFDGVEWVTHGGVVSRGVQETATLDGVPLTADHEVLTYERGWVPAASTQGLHRVKIRLPDSDPRYRFGRFSRHKQTRQTAPLVASMRLRSKYCLRFQRRPATPLLLPQLLSTAGIAIADAQTTRYEQASSLLGVALNARSLSPAHSPSLEKLRRPRNRGMPALGRVRKLLGRYGSDVSTGFDHRATKQQRRLQPGELLLGYARSAGSQQTHQSSNSDSRRRNDCRRSGRVFGAWGDHSTLSAQPSLAGNRSVPTGEPCKSVEPVFDILNCGPRHRFVVHGNTEPFIVHNCVQGTARDLLAAAIIRAEARGWKVVFHCHDELVIEAPIGTISEQDVLALLLEPPAWAAGLPLGGKVHSGPIYLDAPATGEPPAPKDEEIVERAVDALVASTAPNEAIARSAGEDFLASLDETLAPLTDLVTLPMDASGHVSCPFHDDWQPSCRIYTDHWHCFGCGEHGGRMDWLMRVEGMTKAEAIAALQDWTGPITTAQRHDIEARVAFALSLWNEAQPIAGSIAERYLSETRGIDVGKLPPTIHAALRFHPRCVFGSRTYRPCLIALMRDPVTDLPIGIHRIGLAQDNGAITKIDRMALGRMGVVKLWPANGGGQLVVGEGIETTLAAATRISYAAAALTPAWSAISKGGLSSLPVLPGVARLILLVDNDENGEGQKAAAHCRQVWDAAGRTVSALVPKQAGWDFNDVVLGRKA
jgi:hypothetical protein